MWMFWGHHLWALLAYSGGQYDLLALVERRAKLCCWVASNEQKEDEYYGKVMLH